MANIRIDNLPVPEPLTPEEQEQILGAGRPSFRPSFEGLENRELYAANLGGALPPGLLSLPSAAREGALVREFTPVNAVAAAGVSASTTGLLGSASHITPSPALDAALWGGMAGAQARTSPEVAVPTLGASHAEPAQTPGQSREWDQDGCHFKESFRDNGDRAVERWYPGAGGRTFYELQVFKKGTNQRLVYGHEENDRYVLQTWNDRGQLQSTAVYDKAGVGQKLKSLDKTLDDGAKLQGAWKDNKWVETTTGSTKFQTQTEVFDGPGDTLRSRDRIETNGTTKVHGERQRLGGWLETTTDSPDFKYRRDYYGQGGELGWRETRFADGTESGAAWQGNKWVETTSGSKTFQTRTEVYESPGGELLSRETTFANGVKVKGELKGGWWVETTTGARDQTMTGYRVNADGTVTVTTQGPARAQMDGEKVYQRVGDGWKLIAFNHHSALEGWAEESWGADGTYTKNIWNAKQHGQVGAFDHISQTVIANGTMTVTRYHGKGVTYWSGGFRSTSDDATEKWVYSVDADGKPRLGDLLAYEVVTSGGSANHWKKGGGPEYWGNGWKEWVNGDPPRVPASLVTSHNIRGEIVAAPPGVSIQAQWRGGRWVETVWSKDRMQSVTFAYSGEERKNLIAQTYGRLNDKGQWVETTTHSNEFITRTETYDNDKLISRDTTRKVRDGRTVTFHGQWKDGKWVETANDYLGYRSVTVEHDRPDGRPVQRYGQLTDGRYATDTFDSSGGHVVKREIFDKQGGKLLETWTVSGSELTISRDNPTGAIAHDVFHYRWVTDKTTGQSGYRLESYDATFKGPVKIMFDNEKEPKDSTEYHWRTWTDRTGQEHYRESRQTRFEHNQETYFAPYPGEKVHCVPDDPNWNKVD
jgi:hypothetical protein